MKKFFFLILFIVGVGVLLISTCPDQQAHHDAIKGVVSEVVNSEVDQNSIFSTGLVSMVSISNMVAVNLVDTYLKANLQIRDHIFYNAGYINYKGDLIIVSIGVLNHVFTIDQETAKQIMKDKLSFPIK